MKPEELGAYYESILDKEVRKEGGIYYTPLYIVEYIVEHTVGKIVKGMTPRMSGKKYDFAFGFNLLASCSAMVWKRVTEDSCPY